MADDVAGAPAGSLASSLDRFDASTRQVRASRRRRARLRRRARPRRRRRGPRWRRREPRRAATALGGLSSGPRSPSPRCRQGMRRRTRALHRASRRSTAWSAPSTTRRTAALEFGLEMAAPARAAEVVQAVGVGGAARAARRRGVAERGARPPPAAAAAAAAARARAAAAQRGAAGGAARERPSNVLASAAPEDWRRARGARACALLVQSADASRTTAVSKFPGRRQRFEAGIAKAGAASEPLSGGDGDHRRGRR